MSASVTLQSVTYRVPDGRNLIENLTLAFGRERMGLVGRNGVGKTTLIRLILGELEPTFGVVAREGRVALLRQVIGPPEGDERLADILGVREALQRLERLEAGEGEGPDLELADWTLPQRIDEGLAEVGLAGFALDRPASSLSGGEATRAGLAALLIAEPDLLIMDEPTNNLDVEARAAVADLLRRWKGGAIVVSHDRALLRQMDRIVELTSLGAEVYGGGYELYLERKTAEADAAARAFDTAEQTLGKVKAEIQEARERKWKSDARGRRAKAKGGQPKVMLNAMKGRAEDSGGRLTRLAERQRSDAERDLAQAEARIERVRRLAFDLPPSALAAGRQVLAFEDVGFAWPDGRPVLDKVSFRIVGPERVAVTGRNGAGKTTLIRLAVGDLSPTSGTVRHGVEAVLLDQRVGILADDESLFDNFRRLNPSADENGAHAALARFLFRNVQADKPARALSGGERLRAGLACVLMRPNPPQLVVLDEPTNHLDLDSIAAVEAALSAYDGALLVVSHDRDFLDAIGVEREVVLA